MKLSKKLASLGLAVAMVASIGASSVFASETNDNLRYWDGGREVQYYSFNFANAVNSLGQRITESSSTSLKQYS